MSVIGDIRDALADQIIDGTAREMNVSRRGETRPAPSVEIMFAPSDAVEFYATMRGPVVPEIVRFWLIYNPGNTDESAVIRLDDLLSGETSSVVAAIAANPTLGGLVQDIQFGAATNYDDVDKTIAIPVEITVGS